LIRAVIVDDERLARQKVRLMLQRHADVTVVAECADGRQALAALRAGEVDVVFLDVRMPGLDGLGLLRALPTGRAPAVVFVTAHSGYAVEAFDTEAVDYLLKPFDRGRFDRALARARERLQDSPESLRRSLERALARVEAAQARVSMGQAWDRRLAFRLGRHTLLLAVDEVRWIGAEGKYVRVHTRKAEHLVRESMRDVERRIEARDFLRVHRGVLVNVRRVREVHPGVGEDHVVVLDDGTRLPMSRRHRARLRAQGVAL
jgi:two-component system LytT family response regulator